MQLSLSYVVPVHNQEGVLEASVARLVERLRRIPGSEILLVENGSSDSSSRLCARLAEEYDAAAVRVVATESERGIGHAYRQGLELAHGDLIVLTAADLPFGFTDLDAYMSLPAPAPIAIGSKGHRQSRVHVDRRRWLMSRVFRVLRYAVLGLRVADSQGTILLTREVARRVRGVLRCGDFLISTEIICWAERQGFRALELPISYTASGASTVAPLRDSLRMAHGIFRLRRRLRAAVRGAAA